MLLRTRVIFVILTDNETLKKIDIFHLNALKLNYGNTKFENLLYGREREGRVGEGRRIVTGIGPPKW